jgi:chitinase
MIWELAGDYALDTAKNEYYMGSTLTNLIYDKFKNASAYGATKSKTAMPADTLNVSIDLIDYALGDNNYPINPKMHIVNNSTTTIPGSAEITFDYPVSAPSSMSQQSGWTMSVTSSEHTGNNIGGFKGDFHKVSLKLPSWQSLAPGASADVAIVYQLPIAGPSNYRIAFGGKTYGLTQNYTRGSTTNPTPDPTNSPTPTASPTTGPTVTPTPSPTKSASPSPSPTKSSGTCTAQAWKAGVIYVKDDLVSNNGHTWRAKWWTTNETPGTTGEWGVWEDRGPC